MRKIKKKKIKTKTFFCRSLIASFNRFRCIRSPCSNIGPVGSWFSITSSSFDVRVWSNNAVAKSWHCRLNSWYSFCNLNIFFCLIRILIFNFGFLIIMWDSWSDNLMVSNKKKEINKTKFYLNTLNSCSKKLRRRNSQESSKAVSIGSFEESAIKLGLAKARYALIRERECRSESSKREITHSSQPHLWNFGPIPPPKKIEDSK